MTNESKATRATVRLGNFEIEGFMLPDGSYRMSQTQAAEAIGKPEINARRFLSSKSIKARLGKTYTPDTLEIETSNQKRGQSRINALPLEVVSAYWFTQAQQKNTQAIALTWALVTETLERRFDAAFGISRDETEYNSRLAVQLQLAEQLESHLGETYAELDDMRRERDYFELLLRENGIEPYQLPGDDTEPN